jgi:hypothetical protein
MKVRKSFPKRLVGPVEWAEPYGPAVLALNESLTQELRHSYGAKRVRTRYETQAPR